MNQITIPKKQRRHRWVTETLKKGELILSVWPSPDEIKIESKQQNFLSVIAKIGNDPRVTKIDKRPHDQFGEVFLFHLVND